MSEIFFNTPGFIYILKDISQFRKAANRQDAKNKFQEYCKADLNVFLMYVVQRNKDSCRLYKALWPAEQNIKRTEENTFRNIQLNIFKQLEYIKIS